MAWRTLISVLFGLRNSPFAGPNLKPCDNILARKVTFLWSRFVASHWMKNERGERLSSHRSDHATGVWGEQTNLYNVQRLFHYLVCTILVVCSRPSLPLVFQWLDFMLTKILCKVALKFLCLLNTRLAEFEAL